MSDVKKIVVLGGESTGKSTLCEALALHYKTVWVREYAREYLEKTKGHYGYDDLLAIAKGQTELEEKLLPLANQLIFYDTDLHVLKVWSEHKYQQCHAFIHQQILSRKYDAYLLTAPDFPWQHDILREHPEPEMRKYFFELYKSMIEKNKTPYCIVTGNEKQRFDTATDFIENKVKK